MRSQRSLFGLVGCIVCAALFGLLSTACTTNTKHARFSQPNDPCVAKLTATCLPKYEEGCRHNHAQSCTRVAEVHNKGLGQIKNPIVARHFYRKACQLKDQNACSSLGKLYELGQGVSKNLRRAKEMYHSACNDGGNRGCLLLASLDVKGYIGLT